MKFLSMYKSVEKNVPPSQEAMAKMGKLYTGRPWRVKSRKELLAGIKPHQWKYLREDAGDLPDGFEPADSTERADQMLIPLAHVQVVGEGECELRQIYEA